MAIIAACIVSVTFIIFHFLVVRRIVEISESLVKSLSELDDTFGEAKEAVKELSAEVDNLGETLSKALKQVEHG